MDRSHFVHSLIRYLDCFHFLAFMTNAAMDIHVYLFVCECIFSVLLDTYLRVKL